MDFLHLTGAPHVIAIVVIGIISKMIEQYLIKRGRNTAANYVKIGANLAGGIVVFLLFLKLKSFIFFI